MREFFINTVGANFLMGTSVFLTVLLAIVSGLNVWVQKEEGVRDKKEAEIRDVEILEKTETIKELQEELKIKSKLIEYAVQVAGAPRIGVKWNGRNEGEVHKIQILNNDHRVFKEGMVNFRFEYIITYINGSEVKSDKPISSNTSTHIKNFSPNAKRVVRVPELDILTTRQIDLSEVSNITIVTSITIGVDEFISVSEDPHSISLRTSMRRNNNFKKEYTTAGKVHPLFIHRELKYRLQEGSR